MHLVFAENFNLSQVKDSGIQIQNLRYYIAENIACFKTFEGNVRYLRTIEHRNLHRSRQISRLLGDVIIGSHWLPSTLRENQQQCIEIDQRSAL